MAVAQEPGAKPFKTEELQQILAPIALYPDELLSNILMASTYPLEVVQAARWRKSPANAKLKGEALTKALEAKDWDPSVKSLTQFPDVLQTMSEKLDWTQKLGDAFLAQQDDVMGQIQLLRKKADEAGTLKSNKQQKVSKQAEYIVIEPANPEVVYVPVYQPTVVYGSWWYPNYPPYYWYYGRPASSFVSGFFWGAGFAVANSLWGWGHCNWRRNNIDIDINRYNRINVNRTKITSSTWSHDPKHRGAVPYRDGASRDKFGKRNIERSQAREQFRGREERPHKDTARGTTAKERISPDMAKGARGEAKDIKGRVAEKATPSASTKKVPRPAEKKVSRPPSKHRSSPMDVKPRGAVTEISSRGAASRRSAASHRGGGRSGGGRRR
ncbi:MAG: DUF3300 domain-containing protein [Hyphomicrobiaceae bacterium]